MRFARVLRRACDSADSARGRRCARDRLYGAFGYAYDDVSPETAALRARAPARRELLVARFPFQCAGIAYLILKYVLTKDFIERLSLLPPQFPELRSDSARF
jgi:hypothetical protein